MGNDGPQDYEEVLRIWGGDMLSSSYMPMI